MRYDIIDFDHLLERVAKPGRYTDNEVNARHREPSLDKVCFCLAYPDVYEVGFSHQGIKIIYSILNNEPDAMADRVYAPWSDMGDEMQREGVPLFGLETKSAVRDFDVFGITLQSELTYTNILYMLDLAGISLHRDERQEGEPIVLAGGPCGSNPEPLAKFIDVFLIGDGEEAVIEIKDCLAAHKGQGRSDKLKALSEVDGVYVSGYSSKQAGQIKARKFLGFGAGSHQAENQLVPWVQPTHDRLVMEIMRGCSRGCRFCHAGYFYRPVRERSPEVIKHQIKEEVEKYGWEEVGLTSLSSSDYGLIRDLLTQLWEQTGSHDTKLSLPSLRVDSLDETLTGMMNAMQQKNITIAPEAGSQRLRDIINKNFTEEDILSGVEAALVNGWRVLKLYFMIGLPFEEAEDIEAIAELVEKIIASAGRRLQINITVSPFVPKPFTPFQWAEAAKPDELRDKIFYLKNRLKRYRFIKIKYHTIEYQGLECALGRGDERVGDLLESAYREGAIFDGWDEYFDHRNWEKAEEASGVRISDYRQAIEIDSELPWEYVSIGVSKAFFRAEYEKAQRGETTADCREECTGCGLCGDGLQPEYQREIKPLAESDQQKEAEGETESYRVFYKKAMQLRYIGHLDMLRMTYRIVRASGLPIVYSIGYNRHPQVSFGPPLPLGMMSECEYFDLKLVGQEVNVDSVKERLKAAFPEGMELTNVITPVTKAMRSMEYFSEEEVEILLPKKKIDYIRESIKHYEREKEWQITRIRKGKEKLINLKEIVRKIRLEGDFLRVRKKVSGASIYDIIKHIFDIERQATAGMMITRKELFR